MNGRSYDRNAMQLLALASAAIAVFTLSGCSGAQNSGLDRGAQGQTTQQPDSTVAPAESDPTTMQTPIVIGFGEDRIPGLLNQSAAAASLIDQLPLTLTFRDYGSQEKIAVLPAPLNIDGAAEGSDAALLMIGYYIPDQSLVLYYDRVSYHEGIVPLGSFESLDAIENQREDFTATIRGAS